jgi:porin
LTKFASQHRSAQANPTDRARRAGSRRRAIRGRFNFATAVLLACVCCTADSQAESSRSIAPADSDTGDVTWPATAPSEPDLSPSGLLSSFRRERQRWKDAGWTFKLHEQSEVWANLTGGGHQGLSYNGLTIAKLDVDLDKVAGWSGAEFLVEAFNIHGHGPSRNFLGNLQLISNIEATPSIKLYDLWLDQTLLDGHLSIRIGQEGANDEMMVTQYGSLFLNSSFGFPGMPAAVLPSGGPNYPMATPFARAQVKADRWTFVGAIFNGDPAPSGPGDPQIRDRNGTAFRLNDHALTFGEVWYSPDPNASAGLPTTYKLGAWYASSHFADQRFDNLGVPLAAPTSSGLPRFHTGDWAFYGIIDQMLWKTSESEDHGIGVFLQVMGGPSDRNLSNLFIEGGLNWRAPFAQRPDDAFGLAFSYLGISPAARAFSRDLVSFGGATSSYATNETVLEATYQAPISGSLTLQPDAQLVFNPGAGIPGSFGRAPLADALIIGVRFTFKL